MATLRPDHDDGGHLVPRRRSARRNGLRTDVDRWPLGSRRLSSPLNLADPPSLLARSRQADLKVGLYEFGTH